MQVTENFLGDFMNIIPTPNFVVDKGFVTNLGANLTVCIDSSFDKAKRRLESIFNVAKITVRFVNDKNDANIIIVADTSFENEAYKIDCSENIVTIYANSQNGALYATETLRQLANLDFYTENTDVVFSGVEIKDTPLQAYRGLMIDVSRHFFNAQEICNVLDHMARMKLNVFHFHLTDDQGFRFPSKKHPKITELGKTRYGTQVTNSSAVVKEETYSHAYTIEDLQTIIAYAESLGIDVIPEIDLPGHMIAVISAYNELSCEQQPIDVAHKWGIFDTVLCAGEPKMYNVICDLLDEICEVFPSKYIHLGGDEVPKTKWKTCPKCQATMKENGIKTEEDLQGFVFNYFSNYLSKKNKIVIGWNDCLNDELNPDVICEHWTPDYIPESIEQTIKHINNGRKVIMSGVPYYFDHAYGMNTLENTYNYNVYFKGFSEESYKNIIGVECCVWTEWMPTVSKLQFKLFPRLAVFAECAWASSKMPYLDFAKKLRNYYKVYEKLDVYYARDLEDSSAAGYADKVSATNEWEKKQFYFEVNQQLKADGKELLPFGVENHEISKIL